MPSNRKPITKETSAKTQVESNDDTDDLIKSAVSAVNKECGEGAAMCMADDSELTEVPYWLITGIPQLDYAVGGYRHPGIPGGRIIEVFGLESCGKSTLSGHLLKSLINRLGGIGIYQDAECVLTQERADDLGINMKKVIYSQPETVEDAFSAQESVIEFLEAKKVTKPIGIFLDSVASLSTKSEIEGDYGDSTMGIHARLLSQAMRKIRGKISQYSILAVYVNQVREKMNTMGFGEKYDTFGGKALKFYSSVRLQCTKVKTLSREVTKNSKKVKETYGHTMEVIVKKNKVAPPLKTCQIDIRYDDISTLDVRGSMLTWLKSNELIGGSTGFYEIEGKNYRFEEARQLLEDADIFEKYFDLCYSVTSGSSIGEGEGDE